MVQEANEGGHAALRPLREEGALLAALRSDSLPEEELPAGIIRAVDAVEMSLRRLLRDLPTASMEVRLSALAADELRSDELLAELRQHERISMELAAVVHDAIGLRQRLRDGAEAGAGDALLAAQAADRLEHEIANPVHFPRTLVDEPPVVDETLVHAVRADGDETRRRPRWAIPAAVVALLALLGFVAWQLVPRGPDEMDQGVALFQAGNFMDAASHFWRYADQHPGDATPHLYLARIHRRLKRYDMAGQELKKAIALDANDLGVQTELGFLLLDTRRFDLATERFRTVLKEDPASREAWVGLVAALRFSGRADAAQRALDTAPPEVRALVASRAAAMRPPAPSSDTLP